MKALDSPRLKVLDCSGPFNFSAINNRGAREAQATTWCCSTTTRRAARGMAGRDAGHRTAGDVGAVGAKLFYPDGKSSMPA